MTRRRRAELFDDLAAVAGRHGPIIAAARGRTYRGLAVAGVMLLLLAVGLWWVDFGFIRLLAGIAKFAEIAARMLPPTPDGLDRFLVYGHALLETLGLAMFGTLSAACIAFPLGLLAARRVTGSRLLHSALRVLFDALRGIDRYVWALIFVRVVGLGPFAGALAIAMSNIGAFGKLFSETLDASDHRPVEGVLAAGGSRSLAVRFAMLPQAMPVLLGQVLYYFESDTRSATVIGIVGAGGIGLFLFEEIRTLEWQRVAFLIIMILITVAAIDALSGYLRRSFIGRVDPGRRD